MATSATLLKAGALLKTFDSSFRNRVLSALVPSTVKAEYSPVRHSNWDETGAEKAAPKSEAQFGGGRPN
eukprot:397789-Rhodomonas_salina.1